MILQVEQSELAFVIEKLTIFTKFSFPLFLGLLLERCSVLLHCLRRTLQSLLALVQGFLERFLGGLCEVHDLRAKRVRRGTILVTSRKFLSVKGIAFLLAIYSNCRRHQSSQPVHNCIRILANHKDHSDDNRPEENRVHH